MENKQKYYSAKQSHWAGFFYGRQQALAYTTHAAMSDGWNGYPVGFNWKEFKEGFKAGWYEVQTYRLTVPYEERTEYEERKMSDFEVEMLDAVEAVLS